MSLRAFIFYIFACAALLLALTYLVPGLRADTAQQMWIHNNRASCCPHDNCHPAKVIRETLRGYEVEGLSGAIPRERVLYWPFRETYACFYSHDATRKLNCLFRPAPEGS